ncbi:MAG: RNase adapter RapZ [Atopobiaceae bacterium]
MSPYAGVSEFVQDAANVPDVVIITGMSGSGRTQAMHALEDMGYFCIDNLPPRLILQLADLVGINTGVGRHLCVSCDLRSQGLFDELTDVLRELPEHELSYKMVFLDCSTQELMRRYNENRRRHPIALSGESLEHAIERERKQLASVRQASDVVIDTSHMLAKELRHRMGEAFSALGEKQLLEVNVFSFGFKYGMPQEADLMIDARFLENPYYDPEMRRLTGLDDKVRNFVLDQKITQDFLAAWFQMLDCVLPGYIKEGKSRMSVAVGCTGGQHRSVALAVETARHLREAGYHVALSHRDIARADVSPDSKAAKL